MANTPQTWTKLPDGRYRNDSTFQIADPAQMTREQMVNVGVNPSPPAYEKQDPSLNFGANPTKAQELFTKIYGFNPTGYSSTFEDAYQNLGQPAGYKEDAVVYQGTYILADRFAENFLKKTGELPSEDQVKQFVAENLTPGFAMQFIKGLPTEKIDSIVNDYFKGNPDILVTPGQKSAEEKRLAGITDQLNKLYDTGRESLIKGYDETVYNPSKVRVSNDLAAQGMLLQPNSRYSLNAVEANRGRDISGGLTALESERAKGNIDVAKTIEDLLQRNADRNQSAYQFGKTFTANRDDTAFNQAAERKRWDIAAQIGRLQGGAKKGWGAGAAGGAISGAGVGAAFGPWGALLGGAGGALIGGLSA